nr:MAG TPA: hypothetical protein [Caudoviricetes sp.]
MISKSIVCQHTPSSISLRKFLQLSKLSILLLVVTITPMKLSLVTRAALKMKKPLVGILSLSSELNLLSKENEGYLRMPLYF